MALALRFITCLVLTVCIVASVDARISCIKVAFRVAPCVEYLRNGGKVPPLCCFGLLSLNDMVQTTLDRKQACQCQQFNAMLLPGLNATLVAGLAGLPAKCGLKTPYPISMKTNCADVK